MAINFSENLYKYVMDQFGRPITITPVVSQPGAPAYDNRAYFDTKELDVLTEDGGIFSDSKTFIDIRLKEFAVVPMQGDLITIPFNEDVPGGTYEVLDLSGKGNAGGMITITLRSIEPSKPAGITYQELP